MAENATAETSMPSFMRAGMDFFTGKTVLASTLADVEQKLKLANERIAELEKVDAKTLNEQIATLQGDVKTHLATIKAKDEAIATLTENFQTASRQAQQQIVKVGASAPVVTEIAKAEVEKTGGAAFMEKVAAKVTAGVSKSTAIGLCIKEFPSLYADWLKGDTSKI